MTLDEMKAQVPTEPGFYWAKGCDYKWYNLIVHITGTPPFLCWEAWSRANGEVLSGGEIPHWFTFGPRIEEPK